jgi:carbon monoxide dehydrogenase subunit G
MTMRFSGEREVPAPIERVWAALHDSEVLRASIPGCEELAPVRGGVYTAALTARVGPVVAAYRGTFSIEDLRSGREIRVGVEGRGRCGRLDVDLHVALMTGRRPATTALRYEAVATVSGLVARLGTGSMTLAGNHFTGCFFRDLARSLDRGRPVEQPMLSGGQLAPAWTSPAS